MPAPRPVFRTRDRVQLKFGSVWYTGVLKGFPIQKTWFNVTFDDTSVMCVDLSKAHDEGWGRKYLDSHSAGRIAQDVGLKCRSCSDCYHTTCVPSFHATDASISDWMCHPCKIGRSTPFKLAFAPDDDELLPLTMALGANLFDDSILLDPTLILSLERDPVLAPPPPPKPLQKKRKLVSLSGSAPRFVVPVHNLFEPVAVISPRESPVITVRRPTAPPLTCHPRPVGRAKKGLVWNFATGGWDRLDDPPSGNDTAIDPTPPPDKAIAFDAGESLDNAIATDATKGGRKKGLLKQTRQQSSVKCQCRFKQCLTK
jgi:hypothetical protein